MERRLSLPAKYRLQSLSSLPVMCCSQYPYDGGLGSALALRDTDSETSTRRTLATPATCKEILVGAADSSSMSLLGNREPTSCYRALHMYYLALHHELSLVLPLFLPRPPTSSKPRTNVYAVVEGAHYSLGRCLEQTKRETCRCTCVTWKSISIMMGNRSRSLEEASG